VTHRTVRIVQFVNVLLVALVMGVFWGTWFSLSRSIASIRAETFLEVGHTMIANLGGPMSVLMPAALVSSVPLLIVLFRSRRIAAFNLALASLALMVRRARRHLSRQRSDRCRDQSMERKHTPA
jgi:hypothetical protein